MILRDGPRAQSVHGCDKGCLCCGNEAGGERLLELLRDAASERKRGGRRSDHRQTNSSSDRRESRDSSKARQSRGPTQDGPNDKDQGSRPRCRLARYLPATRASTDRWRRTTSGGSYTKASYCWAIEGQCGYTWTPEDQPISLPGCPSKDESLRVLLPRATIVLAAKRDSNWAASGAGHACAVHSEQEG